MEQSPKPANRKKFLLWTAVLIGSASLFKFLQSPKEKKEETIKMLTQDGKLVEMDKSRFVASGKKISNTELQHWIKK